LTPPRFEFRLEKLHSLREREEEHAREELASTLALQVRGEAMLRAAAETVRAARSAKLEATSTPHTGHDLRAMQAWLERTEQERRRAAIELARRENDIEERRAALVQAQQSRKVLDNLRARRLAEHGRLVARSETAQLDELGLAAHRRGGPAA
jgi:flagellar export protein FliJ